MPDSNKEKKTLKGKIAYYKNLRIMTLFCGLIGGLMSFGLDNRFTGILLLLISVCLLGYSILATIKKPWKTLERQYDNQFEEPLYKFVEFPIGIISCIIAILAFIYVLFFIWLCSTVPAGEGPGIIIVPLFIILLFCIIFLGYFLKNVFKLFRIEQQK